MLYTDETTPQVMATIDSQAALCASLSCGYVFENPTAEVAAMTVAGQDVSITGTGLSTTIASVKIGGTDCAVTSNNASTVSCTLESPLRAGTWKPEVRDAKGLLPNAAGIAGHSVPLVVDSVYPTAELNPAGGNIITITGSGFPSRIDAEGVTLEISNAPCKIRTSTPTEMTCETRRFSDQRRRLQISSFQFSMRFMPIMFGEFVDLTSETEVTETEIPMEIESISPATASPILMETLVITLKSGSSYLASYMDTDTFEVQIVPTENVDGGKTRKLNVVSVDSANMQLTVKYGGAQSGIYNLEVKSVDHGQFLVESTITFEAKIQVLDFTPKTGSVFGGSLVTITGGHFSDVITDNPVKFGYNWVGGVNHYCYVQSSSDSEIVCRMATDYSRSAGDAEVIVFASTSEEATWAPGVDKYFNFLSSEMIPEVTNFAVGLNADNTYHMVIDGTDFTGVETIKVGGHDTEVLSVSATQIEIRITSVEYGTDAQEIEIYLSEGIPGGMLTT